MMTRPFKVEAQSGSGRRGAALRPPSPQRRRRRLPSEPGALFEGDFDLGLATFCRGAGIDPRAHHPRGAHDALQLAGQMLREAVLGLMDLNQSRNEFRNRFRMAPPRPGERPGIAAQFLARASMKRWCACSTTTSTRIGLGGCDPR